MDFKQLAARRRSIRKYEDRKVSPEAIRSIIETTLTAPSSKNCRSTRIAFTEDPAILEVISTMRSTGAQFVKDAPLAFFILGDDSDTDLWKENCAISATVLQIAAEDMGLGTCWVHVNGRPFRNEDPGGKTAGDYLKENIPQLAPYRILCVVACGYPAIRPKAHQPGPEDGDKSFRI
ncbi:MAG: nitroreductase family protein [Alistipes sp.]|nr:nitroreductase family protein [Alistipes sp.]